MVKSMHFPCFLPALALGFCAFFTSCSYFTYTKQFDNTYYDSNYISQIGFDKFNGNDKTIPAVGADPQVGLWDFSYRYLDWDGYPYMTLDAMSGIDPAWATPASSGFIAAGETVPSGLLADSSVFRLEMKNLITGGDFEGFADTAAMKAGHWSVTSINPTPVLSTVDLLPSGGINHYSAIVDIHDIHDSIVYSISPITDQFTNGLGYSLDFKWSAPNDPPNGDNNKICVNNSLIAFNPTKHAFADFTAGAANTITFNSSIWKCTIDDISVKKIGNLQLRLLLQKSSTTPSLQDFLYKFSFWIHADTSVGVSTSPYNLDRMAISMSPSTYSTMSTKADADYEYSKNPTGWHKITVMVDNGNLQMQDTKLPVLELVIDLDKALPGRVFIAQPELIAYPDGY